MCALVKDGSESSHIVGDLANSCSVWFYLSLFTKQDSKEQFQVKSILYHIVGVESGDGCEKHEERLLYAAKGRPGKENAAAEMGRIWIRSSYSVPPSPIQIRPEERMKEV